MESELVGFRSFGGIDNFDESIATPQHPPILESAHTSQLSEDIVGNYLPFQSPFGLKPIVYTDWTASGRALSKVENYLQDNV